MAAITMFDSCDFEVIFLDKEATANTASRQVKLVRSMSGERIFQNNSKQPLLVEAP